MLYYGFKELLKPKPKTWTYSLHVTVPWVGGGGGGVYVNFGLLSEGQIFSLYDM